LPAILLGLNSFLLPIFISCAIYLKLICNKKKLFLNSVSIVPSEGEGQHEAKFNNFNDLNQKSSPNFTYNNEGFIGGPKENSVSSSAICVGEIQNKEMDIQSSARYAIFLY
jgi:hypothetical protein